MIGAAAMLCFGPTALGASADSLPKLSVTYTAEGFVQYGNMRSPHKLWSDRGNMRLEVTIGGEQQILIAREDRGRMYFLMPILGKAKDLPLDRRIADLHEVVKDIEVTTEGSGIIAGYQATRYHIWAPEFLGGPIEGTVWGTEHGIPLRADLTIALDGKPEEILMEVTKLVIGPVDSVLFEVPEGTELERLD
jgi:hypothetical protein